VQTHESMSISPEALLVKENLGAEGHKVNLEISSL
jgi:hypothetical protein